jgi:protein-tyrosine phosphatase
VIDIHSHLLPGVDDGSPSAAHSAAVLERMHSEGVTEVVCTPHLNASDAIRAPVSLHHALLDNLRTLAPEGVRLHPGWEIMLDRPGVDLSAPDLALGQSNARLVEFPRRGLPPGSTEELLRLRAGGVIPVVAHPERYPGCSVEIVRTWRELGAVIQTDATALLGGGPMTDFARDMLAEGLVDMLASDNHGDRRSLAAARVWLDEIGATGQADLLTRENPRRLLGNEALAPVEPIAFRQGMLDRLRQRILGGRSALRGESA